MVGTIIAVLVFSSFIGFPIWIITALKLKNKKRLNEFDDKFSFVITDFNSRMNESPFHQLVVSDAMKRLRSELADENHKIIKETGINIAFDKLNIEWIPGEYVDGVQKKYFTDELGRKISGDFKSESDDFSVVRIAYLTESTIGDTAFLHELCHAIQDHYSIYDPNHTDKRIYSEVVPKLREEFDRS